MSAPQLLASGWVIRSVAEFSLGHEDASKHIESFSMPVSKWFVFLRLGGGGGRLQYVLRFYDEEPTGNSVVLCETVLEIFSKVSRNSVARFHSEINLSSGTEVQMSGKSLWITTSERTIMLQDDAKREGAIGLLIEYLKQAQFDLAETQKPSKTLTKRLSGRINKSLTFSTTKKAGTDRQQTGQFLVKFDSLEEVLEKEKSRREFREYLRFSFAKENLDFWEAVERFEKMEDKAERRESFIEIVKRYVLEDSREQVNLPSHQARQLAEVLESVKSNPTNGVPPNVFSLSKNEIFDLMYRNFFNPWVTRQEQKMLRERRAKDMKGSFAIIWTHAGLEGYNFLLDILGSNREDLGRMKRFFQALQRQTKSQLSCFNSLLNEFPEYRDHKKPPKEGTLKRVILQMLVDISKKMHVLSEYTNDIATVALLPIEDLQGAVSTSLQSIFEANDSRVQEMVESRKLLKEAIEKESWLHKSHRKLANLIAQSRKPTKKQKAQAEKLHSELDQAQADREAAELYVSEVESKHGETMQSAFDSLESIELHRLDTMKEIITHFALADRSAQTKLELSTKATFTHCQQMDPIQELVATAKEARIGGKKIRPKTIQSAIAVPPHAG